MTKKAKCWFLMVDEATLAKQVSLITDGQWKLWNKQRNLNRKREGGCSVCERSLLLVVLSVCLSVCEIGEHEKRFMPIPRTVFRTVGTEYGGIITLHQPRRVGMRY